MWGEKDIHALYPFNPEPAFLSASHVHFRFMDTDENGGSERTLGKHVMFI